MNRLTRKTTKKDFVSKAKSYWMGEDESTSEQFIEKFPYTITKGFRFHSFNEYLNKLGRLEDLEEELGCPIPLIFDAIKKGIVIKPYEDEYGYITLWNSRKETELDTTVSKLDFEEPELLFFDSWVFSCSSGCYRGCVRLKDYQKTWWLKGEKCD